MKACLQTFSEVSQTETVLKELIQHEVQCFWSQLKEKVVVQQHLQCCTSHNAVSCALPCLSLSLTVRKIRGRVRAESCVWNRLMDSCEIMF